MKRLLYIVAGLFVFIGVVAAIAGRDSGSSEKADSASTAIHAKVTDQRGKTTMSAAQREHNYRVAHACEISDNEEIKAMKAVDSENWQSAYATALSGLSHLDLCNSDNDTVKDVKRGYLLSAAAFGAHGIGRSDEARTDFNQANQLLVECQTTSGIYGTRAAANCETQEQNNIRAETDWEVGQ